jgi:hypothetical protein
LAECPSCRRVDDHRRRTTGPSRLRRDAIASDVRRLRHAFTAAALAVERIRRSSSSPGRLLSWSFRCPHCQKWTHEPSFPEVVVQRREILRPVGRCSLMENVAVSATPRSRYARTLAVPAGTTGLSKMRDSVLRCPGATEVGYRVMLQGANSSGDTGLGGDSCAQRGGYRQCRIAGLCDHPYTLLPGPPGQKVSRWRSPEYHYSPGGRLAVYRTRDGGETWQEMSDGLPRPAWAAVLREAAAFDADSLYFGTQSGSLFALAGGDTWVEAARHLPPILSVEVTRWSR